MAEYSLMIYLTDKDTTSYRAEQCICSGTVSKEIHDYFNNLVEKQSETYKTKNICRLSVMSGWLGSFSDEVLTSEFKDVLTRSVHLYCITNGVKADFAWFSTKQYTIIPVEIGAEPTNTDPFRPNDLFFRHSLNWVKENIINKGITSSTLQAYIEDYYSHIEYLKSYIPTLVADEDKQYFSSLLVTLYNVIEVCEQEVFTRGDIVQNGWE